MLYSANSVGSSEAGVRMNYFLQWVTDQLAVGHAPMSYDELKSIREQGIDGIVNLCGEYCDLHQIEKGYGFEVYYLLCKTMKPLLQENEKALQWLDEAVTSTRRS
jgi:hypothetical protein